MYFNLVLVLSDFSLNNGFQLSTSGVVTNKTLIYKYENDFVNPISKKE